MTSEQVFDMAVKQAEELVKLKPIAEAIAEDPYDAARTLVYYMEYAAKLKIELDKLKESC